MHFFRKQIALLTALTLLSAGTVCGLPEQTFQRTAAFSGSVLEFAQKLKAQKQETGDAFAELRFSPKKQEIRCDGKASGKSAAGFQVIGGELKMAVPVSEAGSGISVQSTAQQYLSLEEAKEQLGCEVEEKNGEIIVRSPFQTARLLVQADGEFQTHGAVSVTDGYRDLHVLQYRSAAEAYAAYQALKADAAVRTVEPDRIVHAAETSDADKKYIGPTDRWGIEAIGADSYRDWLRAQKTDLPELRVAVIDTGLYEDHAWMQGRVAPNGAAFVDDSDGSYTDENGHGTHCAGIIVSSTLDNVKILPVRVLDAFGGGSLLQIYLGMMYALEQGVDAASMSLGAFGESGLFNDAVQQFAEAGIPLAVAAGNETMDSVYATPSMCPSAFTVSALERDPEHPGEYRLADFSNFGKGIDFSAPGVDIFSAGTQNETSTVEMSGTSMATPYVAACIADVLSYDPKLTNEQVYSYLKANAIDLGEAGFDESYGWGMVNLKNFRFSDKLIKAPSIVLSGDYSEEDGLNHTVTATLKAENAGVKIYYTLDGSEPTPENGTLYQGEKITVNRSMTIRAVVYEDGIPSSVISKSFSSAALAGELTYFGYTDESIVSEGKSETVYVLEGAQRVHLQDLATKDYTYYYTLDGSEPTPTHGMKVNGSEGIYLDESAVLKVRWTGLDGLLSDVGEYRIRVIAPTPAFSLADGVLSMDAGQYADAIYYTLDGSDPVPGKSARFSGGLLLDKTTHVRAVSVSGKTVSEIADYAHIVGGKDIENAVTVKDGVLVSYKGVMENLDLSKETFTAIGEGAFRGNPFLNLLDLPKTCTKIGAYALADMPNLQTVMGGSVTEIGEGTFMNTNRVVQFDASLTEIPAKAFWNASMPLFTNSNKITSIGDYAFFNNDLFDNDDTTHFWDNVETIGEYAFAHNGERTYRTDIDYEPEAVLNLKSVKTIGKHAFENNVGIVELNLPETLTAAPEAMCKDMRTLKVFRASGLTEVGDEALSFTLCDMDGSMEIDFSKIQSLGKRAFSGFVFDGDAEFTALTAIGADAFANAICRGLSFPSVKTVQKGAFRSPVNAEAIYFEHVETLEQNAFEMQGEEDEYGDIIASGVIRNLVFGGDLKTCSEDSFTRSAMYSIYRIAAPADSVLRKVFPEDFISCTPQIDVVFQNEEILQDYETEKTLPQYAECGLRAIPLGFDIEIQWYQTDADTVPTIQNGTPIAGATGRTLTVDTAKLGTTRYFAAVKNSGAINQCSEPRNVVVVPLASDDELLTDETKIVDFTGAESCGEQRYLSYTFTPLKDGIYHFMRNDSFGFTVLDAQNSTVKAMSRDDSVYYYSYTYELKQGEQYTVMLSGGQWSSRFDFIRIVPDAVYRTLTPLSYTEMELPETEVYNGTLVTPEAKISLNETIWNEKTQEYEVIASKKLVKDSDYVLCWENDPEDGTGRIYAFGINGYTGMIVGVFDMVYAEDYYRHLPGMFLNKPIPIENMENETREFVILPSVSAAYTLKMYYSDEQIAEFMADGEPKWRSEYVMTVYEIRNGVRNEIYRDEYGYWGLGLPMLQNIGLTKNVWYVVSISPLYAGDPGALKHAYLELNKEPEANRSMQNVWVDDSGHAGMAIYTGEPLEPELKLYDSVFEEWLVKDEDYKLFYFNNVEPGSLVTVAVGMGRYEGAIKSFTSIQFDNYNTEGNVQTIEPDKPFTVKKGAQGFFIDVREDCYVTMEIPEGAAFKGVIQMYDSFFGWESWNDYFAFDQDTFNVKTADAEGKVHEGLALHAGRYFMEIMKCSGEYELKLKAEETVPDLSHAEITYEDCEYTGEPVKPALRVRYNGTALTEGTDYEVKYPEDMVHCGTHIITVSGIGRFTGSVQLYVDILPVRSLANGQELKAGENTAEITKAKPVMYYAWTPKQEKYNLWSDQLLGKRIQIYEADGSGKYYNFYSLEGIGYQYAELEVTPGRNYLVTASYIPENTEKALTFHLEPDGGMLNTCTVDGPSLVQVKRSSGEINEIPEYRVMDGEKVLEKGKDYEEFYHEGNGAYGRAIIVLRGIGSYSGELRYEYLIAPKEPIDVLKSGAREEDTLMLDEPLSYSLELPGYGNCARFTAPSGGTYYLMLPDANRDSASAFVFNSKLELLPPETRRIELKKGDWIAIAAVSSTAESSMSMYDGYSIGVMTEPEPHSLTALDFTVYVENGSFIITDTDNWDVSAIMLPDSTYDDAYGQQVPIGGFDENLYLSLGRPVIYLAKGSEVDKALGANGIFTLQYMKSTSKVKGDVSGDGMIDMRDADILGRYLSELDGCYLPDFAYANADMNGDGSVDILDVSAILGYVDENGVG